MREVQTNHIHPGFDQRRDSCVRIRGRPESANDFGFSLVHEASVEIVSSLALATVRQKEQM
jgi:hypothetical protein